MIFDRAADFRLPAIMLLKLERLPGNSHIRRIATLYWGVVTRIASGRRLEKP
jgi:hypothetical protein